MLQRGQQCPESPEGSRDSLWVVGRQWGTARRGERAGFGAARSGSGRRRALPLSSVTRICYFPFPRLRFNLYPWRGTGY